MDSSLKGNLKLLFAPEERDVYSNKSPPKYSSLREERDVFPAGQRAVSCCAPTEREPNSVTSGYKHLAPLGRNRQHELVALQT